jgi:hypothetical protein
LSFAFKSFQVYVVAGVHGGTVQEVLGVLSFVHSEEGEVLRRPVATAHRARVGGLGGDGIEVLGKPEPLGR